jgi:hypothetical protein
MQPFDRNIHKLFSIETLMQTNTSSKNYNIHIMKTTHTNTPRYMYANASPLGSGPKSRVPDSREELLAQEIESLTQITEEPRGQVTESLTQISGSLTQVSESRTQVVEPLAQVFPKIV